MADIKLG